MPVCSRRVCAMRIARYARCMRGCAFSPMVVGRAAHSPVSRRAAMMGTARVDPSESSRSLTACYPIPRSPNRHVTRRICLRWSSRVG